MIIAAPRPDIIGINKIVFYYIHWDKAYLIRHCNENTFSFHSHSVFCLGQDRGEEALEDQQSEECWTMATGDDLSKHWNKIDCQSHPMLSNGKK